MRSSAVFVLAMFGLVSPEMGVGLSVHQLSDSLGHYTPYSKAWKGKARYYCLVDADSRVAGQFREDVADTADFGAAYQHEKNKEMSEDYLRDGVPRYLHCNDEYIQLHRVAGTIFSPKQWRVTFGNTRFYQIPDVGDLPPTHKRLKYNYLSSVDRRKKAPYITDGQCPGCSGCKCGKAVHDIDEKVKEEMTLQPTAKPADGKIPSTLPPVPSNRSACPAFDGQNCRQCSSKGCAANFCYSNGLRMQKAFGGAKAKDWCNKRTASGCGCKWVEEKKPYAPYRQSTKDNGWYGYCCYAQCTSIGNKGTQCCAGCSRKIAPSDTDAPTNVPSDPSAAPTDGPTAHPTANPSQNLTDRPTSAPSCTKKPAVMRDMQDACKGFIAATIDRVVRHCNEDCYRALTAVVQDCTFSTNDAATQKQIQQLRLQCDASSSKPSLEQGSKTKGVEILKALI